MIDLDDVAVRDIYTRQAQASRALKRARARLVLEYAHLKAPEMWANVELGTITEADEADAADIEAKVLWVLKGAAPAAASDD